jgi:hypothetical protein
MEKETVEYVDWFELQKEICKEMGIDDDNFTRYHKVIGGKYKNMWHVWLWYIDERMYNDSIMPTGWTQYEGGFDGEYFMEQLKERGYEWSLPFFKAVESVMDRENIKYIKYYW